MKSKTAVEVMIISKEQRNKLNKYYDRIYKKQRRDSKKFLKSLLKMWGI